MAVVGCSEEHVIYQEVGGKPLGGLRAEGAAGIPSIGRLSWPCGFGGGKAKVGVLLSIQLKSE